MLFTIRSKLTWNCFPYSKLHFYKQIQRLFDEKLELLFQKEHKFDKEKRKALHILHTADQFALQLMTILTKKPVTASIYNYQEYFSSLEKLEIHQVYLRKSYSSISKVHIPQQILSLLASPYSFRPKFTYSLVN